MILKIKSSRCKQCLCFVECQIQKQFFSSESVHTCEGKRAVPQGPQLTYVLFPIQTSRSIQMSIFVSNSATFEPIFFGTDTKKERTTQPAALQQNRKEKQRKASLRCEVSTLNPFSFLAQKMQDLTTTLSIINNG